MSLTNDNIPPVVSVNQMCFLLGISRSRYYQLLTEHIIAHPIYTTETKRPFYTKEMAEQNLAVKRTNVGINGKICLFYNTTQVPKSPTTKQNIKSTKPNKTSENKYADILDGLTCLGLTDVTTAQIENQIRKCFPNGIDQIDEGEVLKTVYCAIRAQNSNDNVSR